MPCSIQQTTPRHERSICYDIRVLVFAREVFVCKCSTDVIRRDPSATGLAAKVEFIKGTVADIDRVDRKHHGDEDISQMRLRLERGDHWMIGEVDGAIVAYTWLHHRDRAAYPTLPGCEVRLRADTGYGYDAWTDPDLRGHGLRRVGFLEELNILRDWGMRWEASFFVKHQLDGASRSLGQVGIEIVPIWRVWLKADRTLGAEHLIDDDAAVPVFVENAG
jgi:GNAT superfamily N-acetyltransferase